MDKTNNAERRRSSCGGILSAAVIGYGQFGQVHARKYAQMQQCRLTGIVDSDPARRALARRAHPRARVYARLDELLAEHPPQLASVVVPAARHWSVTAQLLEAGIHVLVEKPLAHQLKQARALVRMAEAKGLVLQPGHLERFNHTLAELHERLPRWRYLEARRMTRWNARALDVDVVMDLMIHDIDMLLALTDQPVSELHASGVKVFSEHWDVAHASLTFADGSTASLTASRASLQPERRLHVFAESACALANIDDGLMLLHRRDGDGLSTERRFCRHEDPLAAEINAFVRSVRNGRPALVSARDGCRAVDIAEQIGRAIEHDHELLNRVARPMVDEEQAIAYLHIPVAQ
ncbi:Gfo/Idh/MocA family protein [Gilvimarinus sp. F26214L]|uniref:Gfo/Idh/MocA family protein n=1 Tax=Gilvimarinus sp. DZF01 TaxID=3461371 RepID=UPI004045ECCD